MQKTQFDTGQKVRIKGLRGSFRYVSRNIVRNIKSGKICSVKMANIREPFDYYTLFCQACLVVFFIIFPAFLIYLILIV